MATPRLGLVVEDKPTELSCTFVSRYGFRLTSPHSKQKLLKGFCGDT